MTNRHAPSSTDPAEATTVIGKGIHIRGELTGSAPIEVWGSLEGVTGTEGRFWVREGGRVGGEIAAAEVIVEGQVEGKISAEHKVELRPTCKVEGDVVAKRVAIAEGAIFDGRIRMSGAGKPKAGPSAGRPETGPSAGKPETGPSAGKPETGPSGDKRDKSTSPGGGDKP